MSDRHPTCADCGATLPTDSGVDADDLDIECRARAPQVAEDRWAMKILGCNVIALASLPKGRVLIIGPACYCSPWLWHAVAFDLDGAES